MKHGEINCSCGQLFYFETINTHIQCPYCDEIHKVEEYPKIIPQISIEQLQLENDTTIQE